MTAPPRSPVSALPGERRAGVGHNAGPPLDPGRSWRAQCWKRARAGLLPKLPLEIVRRRIARARALGLEYPQYASILLGTGRDIVAFLFTSDGLGLRLSERIELPAPVAAKLGGLERCDRLLMVDPPRDPDSLARALAERHRVAFAGAAASPGGAETPWAAGRDAVRAALAPLKLPGDAVVMIGTAAHERAWADAARLARFMPACSYFPAS